MPDTNHTPEPAEGALISEYEVFARLPEWVLDAEISDRAVRLFAVLLRHADRGGKAFPSRRRIAERLRCSTDSVDRAIRELTVLGAMHVERQGGKPGQAFRSNVYRLLKQPTPSRTVAATPGRTAAEDLAAPVPNEREPSNESHLTPLPSAGAPSKPEKRGTRIPADFEPTEALRFWAAEHCPLVNVNYETAQFIDYWTAASGRTSTKKDWPAAWRVWMRTTQKRAVESAAKGGAKPDVLEAALERLRDQ
jgi:hypothetical protein